MDEGERFVQKVETAILDFLRAQIDWHQSHGSPADRRKLVDIAETHVGQRLDHMMAQHDAAGREAVADAVDTIRTELLPDLAARIRSRRYLSICPTTVE